MFKKIGLSVLVVGALASLTLVNAQEQEVNHEDFQTWHTSTLVSGVNRTTVSVISSETSNGTNETVEHEEATSVSVETSNEVAAPSYEESSTNDYTESGSTETWTPSAPANNTTGTVQSPQPSNPTTPSTPNHNEGGGVNFPTQKELEDMWNSMDWENEECIFDPIIGNTFCQAWQKQ